MSIKTRKPPLKETVGAQYWCFSTPSEDGQWSETFEENVEKTEVVKNVKVKENTGSVDTRSSGKIYDTDIRQTSTNIDVEVVAFPADTLAKARGDEVTKSGLILSGGSGVRPFFAYGKVVKNKDGSERYDWYPKCKLTANTDDAETSEETFSAQTDTVTIVAYPFNRTGQNKVSVDSSTTAVPEGLTEEKFFSKPILTDDDLTTAVAG